MGCCGAGATRANKDASNGRFSQIELKATYEDLKAVYDFDPQNVLGAGSFGTVFKGTDK